jgi:hypothetical protein
VSLDVVENRKHEVFDPIGKPHQTVGDDGATPRSGTFDDS